MKAHTLVSLMGLGLVAGPLAGCQVGDGFEPYYGDATGSAPTIASVQTDSSLTGNTGGQLATITGSNFGDDPTMVSVVFGATNAQIVELSGSEIVVVVPQGPVEGGPVDVRIGTPNGQVTLADGFEYVMDDVYENQSAYIVINNDWFSCYGGVGTEFGCDTFAWVGQVGIDGRGEFLEEVHFPRQHGQFAGYWGGADVRNEWVVDKPAYNYVPLDIEDGVEDLRDKRITNFTMTNENQEDEEWCADLSALATYTYGGGDPVYDDDGNLVGVSPSVAVGYTDTSDVPFLEEAEDCDEDDRVYNLQTLQFCETYNDRDANLTQYERAGTWIYDAEWPIGEHSFFVGPSGDPDEEENVTVSLDIPEVALNDVELILPPWARFNATAGLIGFNNDDSLWAIGEFAGCPDGNDDGTSTLDEAAWRFEWIPADLSGAVQGPVKDVASHVRLSVNSFFVGWYGGEGFNMRASIEVPDDNNYDEATGLASVELPTWVLLQFPDLGINIGEQTDPLGNTVVVWGDPITGNYGYLLVTMERVTDYRIEAPELTGDLVVSYVTGDFGFFDWENPLNSDDSCGDCQDNDGDGWTDDKDPDCDVSGAEDGSTFGDTTCNDGLDNDDDGLIDAEDPDCEDGLDGETNCSDGIDNDEDGWTDIEDGECGPEGSGVEVGDDDPFWQCNDGLDNDADGWTDFDDPDCTSGSDDEVGFGTTACNDGLDNDGHGDIDAFDLTCAIRGPTYDTEAPVTSGACANGVDDDGDGYVDSNDPDCEIQPYSVETYQEAQAGWGGWTSRCYNGIDDDGNTLTDSEDPACINLIGLEPDGFLDTEGL